MKSKGIIPLIFAIKGLFMPQIAVAQDFNSLTFSPKAQITFLDETKDISSSLKIYADKEEKSVNLNLGLDKEKIKHNFGASFLLNKDSVWNTVQGGIKYDFEYNPFSFLKQELKTFTGYQNVSNIKVPFLYSAGQFFIGGEENLSFILGNEKIRLEATGILGGYGGILNRGLTWDNYKTGYKISGDLSLSFLDINAWFNQTYNKFNPDKYFFVDSSNNINFGVDLRLKLEELSLGAFFKKEYISGKELDAEKIFTGGNLLFNYFGVGLRTDIELNQLNPKSWKFSISGGKTILKEMGYLEFSLGLSKDNPSFGIGFKFSPKGEYDKIILVENYRENKPLIEEQGYQKPKDFETALKETNTLTKIGNVGTYFLYGIGASPTRTPEEFFNNGFGDCDEFAEYRTKLAKSNGYDSWYVGYVPVERNIGHAFFVVKDKDGRVYATDNDSGAWMKIDADDNASREEISKNALEQLSKYFALDILRGEDYLLSLIDETGIPFYAENMSDFNKNNKDFSPIDTGLMSKIGKDYFY